jgi:hypothetical protein
MLSHVKATTVPVTHDALVTAQDDDKLKLSWGGIQL